VVAIGIPTPTWTRSVRDPGNKMAVRGADDRR
jgi:hypothetical protein